MTDSTQTATPSAKRRGGQSPETLARLRRRRGRRKTALQFLRGLRWLDGTPLLDQVEPYRRDLFRRALDDYETTGRRRCNMVLAGRAKKNGKTLDLCLAALHVLLGPAGPRGNQCYIFASDEDQAGDDLDLVKKLIAANPRTLGKKLKVLKKSVERVDGKGGLQILPGQDVAGSHGKSYAFVGFDEVHTMRDWGLLEAMQLDPNRADAIMWLTSYASIFHRPGVPLFDLMRAGKTGTDPRMLFSWYGADFTTDPAYEDLDPETRANPSRAAWADQGYLAQQQARLPSHQYRRLHLNLPGLPEGSAFSVEPVMDAVSRGVFSRPPVPGVRYHAFVDHSHGSGDDATLCVGHEEGDRLVLDVCMNQGAPVPFSMFDCIPRFAAVLNDYGVRAVTGDSVGGETYREAWRRQGIEYRVASRTTSEFYEATEPLLNRGVVDLVDVPALEQQLLGLVWKGSKITHPAGEHDDFATAAAGCLTLLSGLGRGFFVPATALSRSFLNGQVTVATGTPAHDVGSAEHRVGCPRCRAEWKREPARPTVADPGGALVRNPQGGRERYRDPRGDELTPAAYAMCEGCGIKLPDTADEKQKHLAERPRCRDRARGFGAA